MMRTIEKLRQSIQHTDLFIALVLAVLAVYLYIPALQYPFIWDDDAQIVNNQLLRSAANLPHLLLGPTFDVGGGILAGAYWRPLVVISNFINFQLWGVNPAGFRIYQLLFHALVIITLYFLFQRLAILFKFSSPNRLAIIGTLLYLVQPVHVESVIYIGSIGEVLYTFFALLGVLCLVRSFEVSDSQRSFIYEIAFYVCVGISLLAKESAIIVFLIAAVAAYLIKGKKVSFWLRYSTGATLTVTIYIFFRLFIAHVAIIKDYGSYISSSSLPERFMTVPYIVMSYILKLLVPTKLVIYENTVVHNPLDPTFWLNLIGVLTIGILIYLLARKLNSKLFVFFLGWFCIGLLPILNIYAIDMTVADRWMYFPAIGFYGALTTAILALLKKKVLHPIYIGIFTIILMGYAGRTLVRESYWSSPYNLYAHDVRYVKDSFELINNYGLELLRRGRLDEARSMFERAVQLRPQWFISQTNLGVVYEDLGLDAQAEQQYQKVQYCDGNPFASANLITLYISKNDFASARSTLDEALRLFPTFKRLTFLDAVLKYKMGDKSAALDEMSALLKSGVVDRDIQEFLIQAQKIH